MFFSVTACEADIVFVLDGSGSVGINNWNIMLNYVKRFAASVQYGPNQNRFGVVSFGNGATVNIRLNQYANYADFARSVDGITHMDENTNTAAGIREARTKVFGDTNGTVLVSC